MILSSLIRKREKWSFATAIPAISATQAKEEAATVAKIATVAVANFKEEKTMPPANVGAFDRTTASRWWLIHYHNRDPLEVAFCPDATYAEILECYPDAVAAEPFTPPIRQPTAPLTAREEWAIRAWLAQIEEFDSAMIAEMIGRCQRDAVARAYLLRKAILAMQLAQQEIVDDR